MDFIEVSFQVKPVSPGTDILIAFLSQNGFESFLETDAGLLAYIQADEFELHHLEHIVMNISSGIDISYSVQTIKSQNWNEVWERSYQPVFIRDTIYIRAPFHPEDSRMKYQLLIEPKMSFGTAHHETTHLMMEMMLEEQFSGKRVLDMGCGTGILAIFAEMLGSKSVMAIDNDQNAVENSLENVRKNKCKHIHVQLGDSREIIGEFDFILANITKNTLMNDLHVYTKHLSDKGMIICSGFFQQDLNDLKKKAGENQLILINTMTRNSWIAASFSSPHDHHE